MKINLSPQRRDDALQVTKFGDILTINGEVFDFSDFPEGADINQTLVSNGAIPCEWFTGDVRRIGGELHVTLILPHGPNPSDAVAFPSPIISPPDGMISLPFDLPRIVEDMSDVEA